MRAKLCSALFYSNYREVKFWQNNMGSVQYCCYYIQCLRKFCMNIVVVQSNPNFNIDFTFSPKSLKLNRLKNVYFTFYMDRIHINYICMCMYMYVDLYKCIEMYLYICIFDYAAMSYNHHISTSLLISL